MVVLAFGRKGSFSFLGAGNSKREVARAYVKKAKVYIDKNEFEPAKAELDLAFSSDPKYSYAWSSLAALSYKQGDLKNAVMQTIKAIEYDPKIAGQHIIWLMPLTTRKIITRQLYGTKQQLR